jgi:hypothetical protein
MIQHIQEECDLESVNKNPMVIYDDNAAHIAQIKEGYISKMTEPNTSRRNSFQHMIYKKWFDKCLSNQIKRKFDRLIHKNIANKYF